MASFLVPQKLDYITKGFDRTTLRWYNFGRLVLNDIPYVRHLQAKTDRLGSGPRKIFKSEDHQNSENLGKSRTDSLAVLGSLPQGKHIFTFDI